MQRKLKLNESEYLESDLQSDRNESCTSKYKNLRSAVGDLYLSIKQKTRDENETITEQEEREERDIIMSLDPYIVIEYIKSSVDIILNLKFEEIEKRLLDKTNNQNEINNFKDNRSSIISEQINRESEQNRKKLLDHHKNSKNNQKSNNHINKTELNLDSLRSDNDFNNNNNPYSQRSSMSNMEGPPKVYEELIQNLEADIRKHIRIEQQLKLHIESVENRVEELENIQDKLEHENIKLGQNNAQNQSLEQKIQKLDSIIHQKDEAFNECQAQINQLREKEVQLLGQIEKLKQEILEMQPKLVNADQQQLQLILNSTQPLHGGKPMSFGIKEKSITHKHQDLGSQSSNHSFIDHGTPEKKMHDLLSHPYHQTQQIFNKKQGAKKQQSGSLSSKQKFIVPQTLVESLGIAQQLGAITNTYNSTQNSGKMGQRKLSSQGRNSKSSKINPTKNQWIGQNVPENRNSKSKSIRKSKDRNILDQKGSIEDVIQLNDSLQKINVEIDSKYRQSQISDDLLHFDHRMQSMNPNYSQLVKPTQNTFIDNQNLLYDFHDPHNNNNKRRIVKQNPVNASTGSGNIQSSLRNINSQGLNRFGQQQYQDDKNKLSQNLGPILNQQQTMNMQFQNALQNRSSNIMNNTGSHSQEKHRSRNKKQQMQQNTTATATVMNKFDQSLLDMHFKTSTSVSTTQQSKNKQYQQNSTFSQNSKLNSVTNNTNIPLNNYNVMNQTSVAYMKQQLLANKKASNLLMKGLSPHKK
ncbi:UNKNOWN [Stylonychia lemnae]|uniref:Uncharacterized protein n=1 Tax=Stylonychia lemnae TaxID=5949 RepID=A0A078AEX5_STYLE|nr:UNKNOWN [Stylonychia lemnae]|eukprot:CDW80775.1 UNKNOWN [Stylonychia lemnae]